MFRERAAVSLLLLPAAFWIIAQGGWIYGLAVAAVLGWAAIEYASLFRRQGHRPAGVLVAVAVVVLAVTRITASLETGGIVLAAATLACITWHIIDFERGAPQSATDFSLSVTGIVYLGWIGSFLISLRQLPAGEWWVLTVLPCVWLADTAAFLIGRAIGRNRLAPRTSPKKTWEGYLAGVVVGGLSGAVFAGLWGIGAPAASFRVSAGLPLGLAMGALAPLGDLGISLLKREVRVKDTGSLLPGHGGMLDRIDSWLWAGVLGYLAITLVIP